jgi:Arc/MetJ-type ribon-helix-helix transcriptional regulator
MSVPVTARLDQATVAALDRAVAAGLAPNRGAIVSAAVRDWLAQHGEEAIVASYRRRYREPDAPGDDLVAKLSAFSVAACLAASER